MTAATPAVPDDAALSLALRGAYPRGVRLLQITPERAGHLTLRLEAAGGVSSGVAESTSVVEGLLFAEEAGSFARALADYESMGARLAVGPGLLVPGDGADRELPSLRGHLAPGSPWRLVRHRLERRAVLRLDSAGVHGKLFRSRRRAERAARTLELVRAAGLPAPAVRGFDRGEPLVHTLTVEGRPLLELLASNDGEAACHAAGAVLARIAGAPLAASIDERHSVPDELAVIERWVEPLASLSPFSHARLRRVETKLREAASRVATATVVPSHRDYYDKQVLVSDSFAKGDGVAVVDWDSLALADPALDPGNFLAHIRLRVAQGLAPAEKEEALRRAFLAGRGVAGAGFESRLPFYEAAALLRIAALYSLRPPWARILPGLIASVEESLA